MRTFVLLSAYLACAGHALENSEVAGEVMAKAFVPGRTLPKPATGPLDIAELQGAVAKLQEENFAIKAELERFHSKIAQTEDQPADQYSSLKFVFGLLGMGVGGASIYSLLSARSVPVMAEDPGKYVGKEGEGDPHFVPGGKEGFARKSLPLRLRASEESLVEVDMGANMLAKRLGNKDLGVTSGGLSMEAFDQATNAALPFEKPESELPSIMYGKDKHDLGKIDEAIGAAIAAGARPGSDTLTAVSKYRGEVEKAGAKAKAKAKPKVKSGGDKAAYAETPGAGSARAAAKVHDNSVV